MCISFFLHVQPFSFCMSKFLKIANIPSVATKQSSFAFIMLTSSWAAAMKAPCFQGRLPSDAESCRSAFSAAPPTRCEPLPPLWLTEVIPSKDLQQQFNIVMLISAYLCVHCRSSMVISCLCWSIHVNTAITKKNEIEISLFCDIWAGILSESVLYVIRFLIYGPLWLYRRAKFPMRCSPLSPSLAKELWAFHFPSPLRFLGNHYLYQSTRCPNRDAPADAT